jgi:hypothetical protein
MKQVDLHSLPPCSLSTDCLRLFDDLDKPGITQFSFTEDIQDERLLDLLRLHLPGCPTCTAVLDQARHVHSQQRAMLRDFLIESEVAVPATILEIFAAIRREQQTGPRPDTSEMTIY